MTPTLVRPSESYEGFTHETGRYRRADVGKLREWVRQGIRLGWTRLVSRRPEAVRWEVNSAGECDRPVVAHFIGVPGLAGARFPIGARSYLVTCLRRCRQCEWCLRMRSSHWAHRAETEFEAAQATWLGTLTLSPFHHAVIDARVARRAQQRGSAWLTDWTKQEVFRARAGEIGKEVSKYLKRIRKAGRGPFRYMLVAEAHDSARTSEEMRGRPHYHLLLHEGHLGALVRPEEYHLTSNGVIRVDDKSPLRTQWEFGFTQIEQCRDSQSASYLCKYLSKAMLWRVRASLRYGESQEIVERSDYQEGDVTFPRTLGIPQIPQDPPNTFGSL